MSTDLFAPEEWHHKTIGSLSFGPDISNRNRDPYVIIISRDIKNDSAML